MSSFVTTLEGNKIGKSVDHPAAAGDVINSTLSNIGEIVTDLGVIVSDQIEIDVTAGSYFKAELLINQIANITFLNHESILPDRSVTFILKITTYIDNSYFTFTNGPTVEPFGNSNPPVFELPGTYHVLFTYEGNGTVYYGKAGSF